MSGPSHSSIKLGVCCARVSPLLDLDSVHKNLLRFSVLDYYYNVIELFYSLYLGFPGGARG